MQLLGNYKITRGSLKGKTIKVIRVYENRNNKKMAQVNLFIDEKSKKRRKVPVENLRHVL
jgi:ribosomal protein L24